MKKTAMKAGAIVWTFRHGNHAVTGMSPVKAVIQSINHKANDPRVTVLLSPDFEQVSTRVSLIHETPEAAWKSLIDEADVGVKMAEDDLAEAKARQHRVVQLFERWKTSGK